LATILKFEIFIIWQMNLCIQFKFEPNWFKKAQLNKIKDLSLYLGRHFGIFLLLPFGNLFNAFCLNLRQIGSKMAQL